MMRKIFVAMLLVCSLSACNHVAQGYRPVVNLQHVHKSKHIELASGAAEIREGRNVDRDIEEARRDGWVMLGYSTFQENLTMQQQLVQQAEQLKASMVLLHLLGTQSTSGMTAVPTSTGPMFIPLGGVARTYGATFWVKEKASGSGLYGRNLSQEEAIRRGDGNGMVVAIVSRGYAADRAGLREGDVVTHIAGKEVINTVDAMTTLNRATINSVDVRVQRDGKAMTFSMETSPED